MVCARHNYSLKSQYPTFVSCLKLTRTVGSLRSVTSIMPASAANKSLRHLTKFLWEEKNGGSVTTNNTRTDKT